MPRWGVLVAVLLSGLAGAGAPWGRAAPRGGDLSSWPRVEAIAAPAAQAPAARPARGDTDASGNDGGAAIGRLEAAAEATGQTRAAPAARAEQADASGNGDGAVAIARLEAAAAAAEQRLRRGELAVAEKDYLSVAGTAWRLAAEALIASGQTDAAVTELEHAHRLAPDDAEIIYALAAGYLRRAERAAAASSPGTGERSAVAPGEWAAAAALFDRLAVLRPGAETHVLIGRTWRDARAFDRARASLRHALALDPSVRRAHYYLGMVTVMDEGASRLDAAIAEFREELRLTPADPNANLALGMALVETQRAAEALAPLQIAARSPSAPANALLYQGRSLSALGRHTEAVASFRRALTLANTEAAHGTGADEARLGAIHYQLAIALRAMGRKEEAATEFAAAQRVLAERASNTRDRLTRYLADIPESDARIASAAPSARPSRETAVPPAPLARVRAVQARVCFNLGIMQAQASRFSQAADWFAEVARIEPAFPKGQYSLGVALFNAHRYGEAIDPLTRALAEQGAGANAAKSVGKRAGKNAEKSAGAGADESADEGAASATIVTTRRMLALARFNTDAYDEAAALLRDDPRRDADPSLQYIYGLALVRGNHAAEAEAIFSRLLRTHADSAELTVVLGMAYAQQGDHDNAIATLERALALKPDVAEANGTLGLLYLKQGRLADAAAALRAELKAHPDDQRARHTLATVLDLDGQSDEAMTLLRALLAAKPDHADAHYLLGKILLAQGQAPEAMEHLEAAVRLAPEEPNMHYQLAQAYTKLGRTEQAQREFDAFRELKDKRRERTP